MCKLSESQYPKYVSLYLLFRQFLWKIGLKLRRKPGERFGLDHFETVYLCV